jgi:predicted GIY-YIG superfamily endonuclease
MQLVYVYKITRIDNLSYIGITTNTNHRFNVHRRSNRFKDGIKSIEILEECNSYES